jgi:restriction endonuclease S subunit
MNPTRQSCPQNWRLKSLDTLGKVLSGATPSTRVPEFWNGDVAWITPADLSEQRTPFIRATERSISRKGLESCAASLIPKLNIVISSRAPIGYIAIPTTDFATNQGCKSLLLNEQQDYLFHYYNLCFHVRRFKEQGEGTTFDEISKTTLGSVEVPIPECPTVRLKIGEILVTVDRAIERIEELISKHRHINMGLMQDLFSCGIDANGRVRNPRTHKFKPSPFGQIPVEWDIVTVERAGSVALGRQRSPAHQQGAYMRPYLRVANVFDGWIDYSDVLHMNFSPKEQKTYNLVRGDILLNEGQSLELVGRSALFEGANNVYCFQNTLIRFRCNDTTTPSLCQFVFKFWLDTARFETVARQTTSVAHLGADRFASMPFARPHPEE